MRTILEEHGSDKVEELLKEVVIGNSYNGKRHVVNRVYAGIDGMTIYVEDMEEDD